MKVQEREAILNSFIEEVVDKVDMPLYLEGVQTPESFKARVRVRVHDGTMDYRHQVERGYKTLIKELKLKEEATENFLLTEDRLKKIKDSPLLKQDLEEGKMYQQKLGYTDQEMRHLYVLASELFEARRFSDAADCFFFLVTLNPLMTTYWIATACAYEQMHQTIEAYQSYLGAILVNPLKLDSWRRALRCCSKADHFEEKEALLKVADQVIKKLEEKGEERDFSLKLKELIDSFNS